MVIAKPKSLHPKFVHMALFLFVVIFLDNAVMISLKKNTACYEITRSLDKIFNLNSA